MRIKRVALIVGSGLAAIALLSAFRGGCGGRWGHGHDPERAYAFLSDRVDDHLDDLNATDDQRQKINAVKDRLFNEGKALVEQNRGSKEQVLTQWESANPDSAALHNLVDARVDAFRAFGHKVVDAFVEVHRVLTPEQRNEITEHVRKRIDRSR